MGEKDIIDGYLQFIENKKFISEKQRKYYAMWVERCSEFSLKKAKDLIDKDMELFIDSLYNGGKTEPWQIKQAGASLIMFIREYLKKEGVVPDYSEGSSNPQESWSKALNTMRDAVRLRHYSYKTEQTYLGWIRRFARFLDFPEVNSVHKDQVEKYLTYLAVDRKVAASTQNQAFNSILFFFRMVLKKEMGEEINTDTTGVSL